MSSFSLAAGRDSHCFDISEANPAGADQVRHPPPRTVCPLWVTSRHSTPLVTNVGFEAVSRHSEPGFRSADFVAQGQVCRCLLSPKADVRPAKIGTSRRSANGRGCVKTPWPITGKDLAKTRILLARMRYQATTMLLVRSAPKSKNCVS